MCDYHLVAPFNLYCTAHPIQDDLIRESRKKLPNGINVVVQQSQSQSIEIVWRRRCLGYTAHRMFTICLSRLTRMRLRREIVLLWSLVCCAMLMFARALKIALRHARSYADEWRAEPNRWQCLKWSLRLTSRGNEHELGTRNEDFHCYSFVVGVISTRQISARGAPVELSVKLTKWVASANLVM